MVRVGYDGRRVAAPVIVAAYGAESMWTTGMHLSYNRVASSYMLQSEHDLLLATSIGPFSFNGREMRGAGEVTWVTNAMTGTCATYGSDREFMFAAPTSRLSCISSGPCDPAARCTSSDGRGGPPIGMEIGSCRFQPFERVDLPIMSITKIMGTDDWVVDGSRIWRDDGRLPAPELSVQCLVRVPLSGIIVAVHTVAGRGQAEVRYTFLEEPASDPNVY